MTIAPLLNVPITQQDTLIEVVRKEGHPADEVFVTTNLTLAGEIDSDEEVTLLLPMSGQQTQQPLLRWTEDDIRGQNVAQFDDIDRPTADVRVAEALQAVMTANEEEQQALANAIKEAASGGFSTAVLTVKPGQRNLRFFVGFAAPRGEDGFHEFALLGPWASFVLQGGAGISVVTVLPRGATQIEATALRNPADPGSTIEVAQHPMANRTVLGWFWQNDPLFRVRYRY